MTDEQNNNIDKLEPSPVGEPAAGEMPVAEQPVAAAPELAAEQPKSPHPDLKWYVVHTYSGFEFKAKQALDERVRAHNFTDYFGEIRVPQETVVELVRGQKKTSNR